MANDYDKILKENIGAIFLALSETQLGISIAKSETIKDKLQSTLEREPDFLNLIEDQEGNRFILHLEFQTENEKDMIFRMQEYHGILQKKYQLPVKQFVIYLGKKKASMRSQLEEMEIFKGFTLLDLQHIPYTQFVNSNIPEEIILAILCNFKEKEESQVLDEIIQKLKAKTISKITFDKYAKQITIFSRLRNLTEILTQKLENMTFDYNIEEDILYKRGIKKGMEKGIEKGMEKGIEKGIEKGSLETKIEGIQEAIKQNILTLSQIAALFKVDKSFVLKVKEEMN